MIPQQLKNLKFCRIKNKSKKPFEKDWTNKPYTYEEILLHFKNENYGVLCGYENLAVIDCDNEELALAVDTLLPKTFKVKTGGGGTHFYYFIPELKQKIILETSDGIHLGEVQSKGTQVVGPNSIHPNKNKYEVIDDTEIFNLSLEELYSVIKNFMKETKETEVMYNAEVQLSSDIDSISVASIWGLSKLKNTKDEYYGEHPIHGSDGGCNFWINPSKNTWHCFRCNSGGGPLSAIAVKEGIIQCSDANRGSLRGAKAFEAIKKAEESYGLKPRPIEEPKKIEKKEEKQEEIEIIWDKDLQTWKEEEKEWIIDKLIPSNSVCVLTGKRGTLKTFIALNMAYSIATGTKFLNNFSTRSGGVLYLDKENGVHIMKKRTAMLKNAMNLDIKDIKVGFICFSQLKIDRLGDTLALEKVIEQYKPNVLFIDTYRRSIRFDENDAGAVSKLFVDTLRPIVEQQNISIVLIHHDRKGGAGESGDEMDEIRGSSDLANYADIILKMERRGNNLILKQLKNRNAPEEKPIKITTVFDDDKLELQYGGEYSKKTKVGICVEILLLWVTKNQITQFSAKQAKEVAFKEGVKESTFKNALIEMQDNGLIENIEFGIYKVNEQQIG